MRHGKVPTRINGKKTKEYIAYKAMVARCQQTMPSWKKWCAGTIYENMEIEIEWIEDEGFQKFYEYIGKAPIGAILDRIDNNKGYIKGNIRWATTSQSNKNRRNATLVTAFGKTQNLCDWSKEVKLSRQTIMMRINKLGWDPEKALSTSSRLGGQAWL